MYNPWTKQFRPDSEAAILALDIETLSLAHNALITEIALMQVTPVGGIASFEKYIHPDDYETKITHFDISEETLSFHDRLKGDYLWELRQKSAFSQDIADALFMFLCEFRDIRQPVVIYCRGTDFDPPRLKHFMQVHGYDLGELVHYRNFRDLRTVENLFNMAVVQGDHSAINDVLALRNQLITASHSDPVFHTYLWGRPDASNI